MTYNKAHIQGLIIEKIANTISEEDNKVLADAIKEDQHIEKMWEEMQQTLTSDKASTFFNNLDERKAWEQVEQAIEQSGNVKQMGFIKWLSIAALFCIALSSIWYWGVKPSNSNKVSVAYHKKKAIPAIELQLANGQHINLSDTSKRVINIPFAQIKKGANGISYKLGDNKIQEWSTLVVPSKLDYQIVLSDGTQVWLNAASSLRFPFSFLGATREVYLTGEAFFKVAKNPDQPFIVHTGQTEVKVLGTEFNVNTYNANITTTSLVEGSVSTSGHNNNEKLLLKPGYQAVYIPGVGFITQPFDANIELAWMHGIYYFHDTKLSDISQVLLRWFDLKVVFDNPAVAEESFSGVIEKNKPIEVFLQNLKISANVKADFKDQVLHIK